LSQPVAALKIPLGRIRFPWPWLRFSSSPVFLAAAAQLPTILLAARCSRGRIQSPPPRSEPVLLLEAFRRRFVVACGFLVQRPKIRCPRRLLFCSRFLLSPSLGSPLRVVSLLSQGSAFYRASFPAAHFSFVVAAAWLCFVSDQSLLRCSVRKKV
jgi:hypothetical protein